MTRLHFALATLVAFGIVTTSTGDCAATLSPLRLSWVAHPLVASPSARGYMACAYDPVSQRVVMFGGFDGASWLRDTWTYYGTTWTQILTPISPGPRAGHAMAYDEALGSIVVFGGETFGGAVLDDTWWLAIQP
jgi:hypothetical protein